MKAGVFPAKPFLWISALLAAVILGAGLSWILFGEAQQERKPEGNVLAVFGTAPEFTLTERSDRNFSGKELLGRPWIADFIFTSCAGQCPLMSSEMQRLQNKFSKDSSPRFVSFTVDPERDTPQTLSKYADGYNADKDNWLFLTGPKEDLNRIQKGFFLTPAEEPMMHSIRFILVDSKNQIRGYYDSSDPGSMKQILHDTHLLLETGR